ILQVPSFQSVISSTPQGDAFMVKDVTAFSQTVLPRMYKHQNFSSFVCQLNKYDFHKVSVKEGADDSDHVRTSSSQD
ncbi:HSF-type DNA-binding-domain-containing protein, partial [Mucidula mucida]